MTDDELITPEQIAQMDKLFDASERGTIADDEDLKSLADEFPEDE